MRGKYNEHFPANKLTFKKTFIYLCTEKRKIDITANQSFLDNMKISHIGIWTAQIEKMKTFYTTYFNGQAGDKYTNTKKGFESYFIHFSETGSLELMSRTDVNENRNSPDREYIGLAHLSFSAGSKENVDSLTEKLRHAGYRVTGEPRMTGDGFYESVVLDPDNNRIEITG